MALNPLSFEDLLNFYQSSIQNGINPPHVPPGYVMASDPNVYGAILPRLFSADYITLGIINPNRLGTGYTGAGNLFLADDGTWKTVSGSGGGGGSVPTLTQVTTAGNETSNNILVGLVGSKVSLSRMTSVGLGNIEPNFTISNYDTLSNGAVIYRNLSGGAAVNPLINGTTYYVKKLAGLPDPMGSTFARNQVALYTDVALTNAIFLTSNIVGNHYLEQYNRTLTNTLISNQNFQIDDGLLLINAKPTKIGEVHWISPNYDFWDRYSYENNEGEISIVKDGQPPQLKTTLLVGAYNTASTNPIINATGTCIMHFEGARSFMGIASMGVNYGILGNLNLKPTGAEDITVAIGGYYSGMGVISLDNSNLFSPSFGILAKNQSGNGRGFVNFTVYSNKVIHTFNNVLDDGSGQMGINCVPSNTLHIVQPGTATSAVIRIDSNATSSTTLSSQIQFYRASAGAVINGAVLLGKVSAFGLSTTPGTYTEGASMEFRSISGAWSTAGNRSAQILFSTRNANTFAERARITQDGNLLINTTTSGGFRLDVNGSFRTTSTINATLANVTTSNVVYYNTTTGELTHGALPTPVIPTLAQVTTAGNTTTNGITVGASIIDTLTVGRGSGGVATNTVFGFQPLNSNTTGTYNLAIGYQTLFNNTTGRDNVALGSIALYSNISGRANMAIGDSALLSNTTGGFNVGVGVSSLGSNTIGFSNVAIGDAAVYGNTEGSLNIGIGANALFNSSTGNNNIGIGYYALRFTESSNNLAIGYKAGYNNFSGVNNIFIGYQTDGVSPTESNRTFIGNLSTTSTWLAGNLLLGTTTDAGFKLDVNGTFRATGNADFSGTVDADEIRVKGTIFAQNIADVYTLADGALESFNNAGYTLLRAGGSTGLYLENGFGGPNLAGIWTNSPQATLDVNGTFRALLTNATHSSVVYYNTTTGELTYGALPSFTETDPIFTASPSFGITSTLINNWNTAYNNRIISLTTTGSSGASTLISNVLNIPNYTLAGLGGQPALSGTGFVKISGTTISYDNSTYYLASNPSGYQTTSGTVANIASGAIGDLDAAWIAPGTSIDNGFRVYRYNSSALNKPALVDNANWLINIYSHPSGGTASYGHQIAAADADNIYFRKVLNGSFSAWYTFLHSGNFNTYSPTLAGTGASGTWGINITGSAGSLSNMNISQFTNNSGYISSYAETDTLATVTTRGNTTANAITVGNLVVNTTNQLVDFRSNSTLKVVFSNINNPTPAFGTDGFAIHTGGYGTALLATKGIGFGIVPDNNLYTGAGASVFLENGNFGSATTPNGMGVGAGIPFGTRFYVQSNSNSVGGSSFFIAQFYGTSSTQRLGIQNDGVFIVNTDALYVHANKNVTVGGTVDSGLGKLQVNGIITATGGTSTNWNTAFGWGNHASAGYLTSQPWAVSGNNIYYNTGNVGIGTAFPGAKLDVSGGIYGNFFAGNENSYNKPSLFRVVTNDTNWAYGSFSDNSSQYWMQVIFAGSNLTTRGFRLFNANSNSVPFLVNGAGNVLIGTTTDAGYRLDVNGSTRVSSLLDVVGGSKITIQGGTDGGNSRGIFMWNHTDANWGIYMSTAGAGKSLSGGNAPAALDGGTGQSIRFRVYAAAGAGFIWESNNQFGGPLDYPLMSLTADTGNLYVRGLVNAASFVKTGGTSSQFLKADGSVDSNTYLTSQPWLISGSNIYYNTGNIGVGTTTPNAHLNIQTLQGGSKISTTHETSGSYPKASGISFGATSTSLTVSNNGQTTVFAGGAGIYANNSAASNNPTDLLFWTTAGGSPTQRMIITTGGNIGIGTNSPQKKLHVEGDVFIKGSASLVTTKIFEVQNSNGTSIMDFRGDTYAFFGCGQGGGSASGFIFRYSDTNATQFTGYNYGSGSSPSYKPILMDTDVVGRNQGIYINYGSVGQTNPFPTDTEFAVRGRASTYVAKFDSSTVSPLLYVRENGNVLIGTSTDGGFKLDVNGTIRSNNVITATGGTSTNWNTAFGWGDHAAAGYIIGTTGASGSFTVPTNPPGMQTLNIVNGLIISIS